MMEKLTLMALMLLASMFIAIPVVHGIYGDELVVNENFGGKDIKEIEQWFQKIRSEKQKLTKFHFYFHAIPKGNTPNQINVSNHNITDLTPTLFGMLNIVDYQLTQGPELSSKLVGRAQGFYASVSLEEMTFVTAVNLIFPDGSYISTSGLNAPMHTFREMPITGGAGAFRLAQGVVILKPYLFDLASGNATVEMNVLALHY